MKRPAASPSSRCSSESERSIVPPIAAFGRRWVTLYGGAADTPEAAREPCICRAGPFTSVHRRCCNRRRNSAKIASRKKSKGVTSMLGVVATIKVKEGQGAEFEKVATELVKKVNDNEKGCLLYQLYHGEQP